MKKKILTEGKANSYFTIVSMSFSEYPKRKFKSKLMESVYQ